MFSRIKNLEIMKRNESIEDILNDMDHTVIKKFTVFPKKSAILFVLSIAAIVLDKLLPSPLKNDLIPLVAILVLALLTWSFLLGALCKTYYKNQITNQKVIFFEMHFDRTEFESLVKIIASRDFYKLNKLHKSRGDGINLKIAYTADKSLCLVQGLKYMPFQYAIRTEVNRLSGNEIEELLNSIQQTSFAV
jgi:hypothetical protein